MPRQKSVDFKGFFTKPVAVAGISSVNFLPGGPKSCQRVLNFEKLAPSLWPCLRSLAGDLNSAAQC
jgi:hypothetical protein